MFLVFLFMRFLYKFVNSPSKGGDEKQLFHQFFCMITITNTMTNTESRDFVFIFSGKSLISNLIMVNCSEFTKLIIKFHLLLATQISGWRARCHMHITSKQIELPLREDNTHNCKAKAHLIESYCKKIFLSIIRFQYINTSWPHS